MSRHLGFGTNEDGLLVVAQTPLDTSYTSKTWRRCQSPRTIQRHVHRCNVCTGTVCRIELNTLSCSYFIHPQETPPDP